MTDITSFFGDNRYTLILVSNFLPGFLLFELIETTTSVAFSTEFKLVFSVVVGFLITEWFYEYMSIIFNLYTLSTGKRDTYKDYLDVLSPIRMLRKIAKIKDHHDSKKIWHSSYSQSMSLNCAIGSIGWLLVFFALLTWKGLFYLLFVVSGLISLKTLCRVRTEEKEWIPRYTLFLLILLVVIGFICFIERRSESEIIFIYNQNNYIDIHYLWVLGAGAYFILLASSTYFYAVRSFLEELNITEKNKGDQYEKKCQ